MVPKMENSSFSYFSNLSRKDKVGDIEQFLENILTTNLPKKAKYNFVAQNQGIMW